MTIRDPGARPDFDDARSLDESLPELRRQVDVGVGCGCAYPDCTSDESVSRSNRIHKMLSIAIDEHPELKELLVRSSTWARPRPCAPACAST